MKKNFLKITSALVLGTGVLFTTETDVEAAPAEDTFTVIHTNDMHGRMNESPREMEGTLLSRLKTYVDQYDPDLLLDGGDAIQGLPMANLNDGVYMVDAMIEIGYDAMAVGNHEFDFGYDNIQEIKNKLAPESNMSLLSSNVEKDGELSFKAYDIVEKSGKKIAIIGFTTPETLGKTHPDNTVGVEFLDIETQAKKYIDEILANHDDIDLFAPIAHLGTDGETKDEDRGDFLSQKIADYLADEKESDIPVLFVDGHSHTEEEDRFGRDNLLYVQTGEHLNNVGHVELNFDDFTKSTAKLVPTEEIEAGPQLEAEKDAEDFFGDIAEEVITEDLPYRFSGERENIRTHETNLGNLIGDSMVAYGESLGNKPDLAVMNGGGIRVSLDPGEINRADVISVIPFGNTYASIEVTGQDIKDMFEHSYRTPVQVDDEGNQLKDELGNYLLEPNGGFLQVSGNVKVEYDALADEGIDKDTPPSERNRILKVMLKGDNGWEEMKMDGTYTLATNDFLAQGGDGYTMLGGERIEGDSLDDVFARFLQSDQVDWAQYEEEYNPSRIIQVVESSADNAEAEEAAEAFEVLIAELPSISELSLDDKEELLAVRAAYEELSDEAKGFVGSLSDLEALENQMSELEKEEETEEEEEIPEEPTKPVEEEETEEEKEEEEAGAKLPQTGESESNAPLIGIAVIITGLGAYAGINRKKLFNK